MNLVWTIRVGGENHCIEADDLSGAALPMVGNLTEQCDSCGAGGPEATFTRHRFGGHYACDACGHHYPISRSHPRDTVFP